MSIVKNEPKYKNGLLQAIRASGAWSGRSSAIPPSAAVAWTTAPDTLKRVIPTV